MNIYIEKTIGNLDIEIYYSKDNLTLNDYLINKKIPLWLKIEHLFINYFLQYDKPCNYSNNYIAFKLGLINKKQSKNQKNNIIRKITDHLSIIKNKRNTFNIEQKYKYHSIGSYRDITINWYEIIKNYHIDNKLIKNNILFNKCIRYSYFKIKY